jgi:hypothetical protein
MSSRHSPAPTPSPLLLAVSLPSPPVRRKHILPRPASPPVLSLDASTAASATRSRKRTVSAGPLAGMHARGPLGDRARSETRERAPHGFIIPPSPSSPSTVKRSSLRGRSGSPPPASRRRSASPPPPVPAIPSAVRARYPVSIPVSAPPVKTQFSSMETTKPRLSPPALPPLPLARSPGSNRIADIMSTRREANGVTYWDFSLPTPSTPVPHQFVPELQFDSSDDSADDDSRASTPTLDSAIVFGSYPRAPASGHRASPPARKVPRAVTVARFLGIAEPRLFAHGC